MTLIPPTVGPISFWFAKTNGTVSPNVANSWRLLKANCGAKRLLPIASAPSIVAPCLKGFGFGVNK